MVIFVVALVLCQTGNGCGLALEGVWVYLCFFPCSFLHFKSLEERFLNVVLLRGNPTHTPCNIALLGNARAKSMFSQEGTALSHHSAGCFPHTKEFVSVALRYCMSFAVPRPVGWDWNLWCQLLATAIQLHSSNLTFLPPIFIYLLPMTCKTLSYGPDPVLGVLLRPLKSFLKVHHFDENSCRSICFEKEKDSSFGKVFREETFGGSSQTKYWKYSIYYIAIGNQHILHNHPVGIPCEGQGTDPRFLTDLLEFAKTSAWWTFLPNAKSKHFKLSSPVTLYKSVVTWWICTWAVMYLEVWCRLVL